VCWYSTGIPSDFIVHATFAQPETQAIIIIIVIISITIIIIITIIILASFSP